MPAPVMRLQVVRASRAVSMIPERVGELRHAVRGLPTVFGQSDPRALHQARPVPYSRRSLPSMAVAPSIGPERISMSVGRLCILLVLRIVLASCADRGFFLVTKLRLRSVAKDGAIRLGDLLAECAELVAVGPDQNQLLASLVAAGIGLREEKPPRLRSCSGRQPTTATWPVSRTRLAARSERDSSGWPSFILNC